MDPEQPLTKDQRYDLILTDIGEHTNKEEGLLQIIDGQHRTSALFDTFEREGDADDA